MNRRAAWDALMVVVVLVNVVGIVSRWLGPPPALPSVSRIEMLVATADLWTGAWFDPQRRVLWTATGQQTHTLCADQPSQWDPSQGGTIGGCYLPRADIIVLPVDASPTAIDHEWCHRVAGWRHPSGKTDNEGWPAACEARPWRTGHAFATQMHSNAR